MEFIIGFILIFGVIRLSVAFCNWISQPYLPKSASSKFQPSISILIPVRNEEKNIEKLLSDLERITYQQLEIIVYNDCSTDNTGEILKKYSKKLHNLKIMEGQTLPEGWLGKNHACYNLANAAKNDHLLFIDADVRLENGLIEDALAYLVNNKLSLLSIFPKQLMPNYRTRLAVPLMNWILLSLLPLLLVKISKLTSFSAANGQFMLFNAFNYKQLEPHNHFKNNKVEDIAIIMHFKSKKLKVCTLLGDNKISCTMYTQLKEAINGFSKNIFQFFGGSVIITFSFVAITSLSPFILLFFSTPLITTLYLSIILLIRIFVSLVSKQSVWKNILLILPQQCILILIVCKAFNQKKNKKMIWKDRNILSEN